MLKRIRVVTIHAYALITHSFASLCIAAAIAVEAAGLSGRTALADDEFPRELVDFVPYEKNPVFSGRGEGHWDEKINERGWILREDNLYRMWYTGYQPNGAMKLGYATSPDGLAWTRHPENPLYDKHWVEDMIVVKHDDVYYMFVEGDSPGPVQGVRIDLLTSADGVRWKLPRPTSAQTRTEPPVTLHATSLAVNLQQTIGELAILFVDRFQERQLDRFPQKMGSALLRVREVCVHRRVIATPERFGDICHDYLADQTQKVSTTVAGETVHVNYLKRILRAKTPLQEITLGTLRHYKTRRKRQRHNGRFTPEATIKKELVTSCQIWMWASHNNYIDAPCPLVTESGRWKVTFEKRAEPEKFKIWAEIERRIKRGGFTGLTVNQAHRHFEMTLSKSKWSVVTGFHVLRHSFASNLARTGTLSSDVIARWMGHTTEEMKALYQHLFPQDGLGQISILS